MDISNTNKLILKREMKRALKTLIFQNSHLLDICLALYFTTQYIAAPRNTFSKINELLLIQKHFSFP